MKRTLMFLGCLWLFGCATQQLLISKMPVEKLSVDLHFRKPENNAAFTIRNMYMNRDTLTVEISYTGGCEKHSFNLIFNGNYIKTYPPKAELFLKHDKNNDHCTQVIYKTLRFDVSALQYPGTHTLTLKLNNTEQPVKYTY